MSEISKAGYQGELAGGGLHSEEQFRQRIKEITECIPAGEGITINILYLNARLWDFSTNYH